MRQLPANKVFAYALIATLVGSLFSLVMPTIQPSFALHENVTINVSDDVTETYGQGDSIAFVGSIDDVEDGEDVALKFKNPSGNTVDDDEAEEDEDDGYFDYEYDIPDNAADGVWTVEAAYSGDKMFTYFIVDEDDDTITVELDNDDDGIYGASDEVTILGQVDDADSSEENVEITVYGPDGEPLNDADGEDVELDGDEFEFSFELDDAPHGRYAVVVTYDVDEQEGSTLFEIEDEDEGSSGGSGDFSGDEDSDGDLSAQIEDDSYEPGGNVAIEGTIDGYDDSDNIDLEVVVEDPEGDEVDDYGDDSASVHSNGDFEYDFDLDDNADEGTYTVRITYDNDEIAMEFEVSEGGGGSSGSSDLTVKLNKASFLAGETMTVTGTVKDVADPDDGEQVSVFMYDPESKVILVAGSSKYVTPSSSGAFSATLTIPSSLDVDDGYKVIVGYLSDQAQAIFSITGVSSTPSDELTVDTDKDTYELGQTIKISGKVPATMLVEGRSALILIEKPDGGPCRTDQVAVPSGGSFTYSAPLAGNCGVSGEYEVQVSYTGVGGTTHKAKTTFELSGSSASSYSLKVGTKTYPIEYELSDGTLSGMSVPKDQDGNAIPKLLIRVNADQDGQLKVVLPRDVLDAIKDGGDIDFVVTAEDADGNIEAIDFDESETTDNDRTLLIDFAAGTERIEVQGTQVVPEFGAIAAIVMAVAIVGIIMATQRSKFSLFRQ